MKTNENDDLPYEKDNAEFFDITQMSVKIKFVMDRLLDLRYIIFFQMFNYVSFW